VLVDDTAVGGDAITLREEQDVARDDLLRCNLGDDAVAQDDRALCERLGKRADRLLGRDVLPEAQRTVQHEHGNDRGPLDDVADRDRHRRCPDEQQHEGVEQLAAEHLRLRRAPGPARPVRAVAGELRRRLGGAQPDVEVRA
jgi:hypothetical protein